MSLSTIFMIYIFLRWIFFSKVTARKWEESHGEGERGSPHSGVHPHGWLPVCLCGFRAQVRLPKSQAANRTPGQPRFYPESQMANNKCLWTKPGKELHRLEIAQETRNEPMWMDKACRCLGKKILPPWRCLAQSSAEVHHSPSPHMHAQALRQRVCREKTDFGVWQLLFSFSEDSFWPLLSGVLFYLFHFVLCFRVFKC